MATVRPSSTMTIMVQCENDEGRATQSRGRTTEDNNKPTVDITNNALYTELRSLFLPLILFGMHFNSGKVYPRINKINVEQDNSVDLKKGRSCGISRFNSSLVIVILWLNLARMMTMFAHNEEFNYVLFGKLLPMSYMIVCTLQATMMYIASCRQQNGWNGFFQKWQQLQTFHEGTGTKYLRRHVVSMVIAGWLLNIVNVAFTGYGMYNNELFDVTLTPLNVTGHFIHLYRAIYLVIHWYMGSAWSFSVVAQFLICLVLHKEFVLINTSLRDTVNNSPNEEAAHQIIPLEKFRKWHQNVCHLVDQADDIFSLQCAAIFFTSTVNTLLILYMIIYYDAILSDPLLATINFVWLASSIAGLGLTCVYGAMVNHVVSLEFVRV